MNKNWIYIGIGLKIFIIGYFLYMLFGSIMLFVRYYRPKPNIRYGTQQEILQIANQQLDYFDKKVNLSENCNIDINNLKPYISYRLSHDLPYDKIGDLNNRYVIIDGKKVYVNSENYDYLGKNAPLEYRSFTIDYHNNNNKKISINLYPDGYVVVDSDCLTGKYITND